jgi:CelD/BcsL family acetyltransferase involved in cellulose biosynthesis
VPFSILAISDLAELESYVPSWDDLAAEAVEPNVFYESWMLLSALRAYGGSVRVVLVFADQAPRRHGKPLLCGLFPLVRQRRGLVSVQSLWCYLHCFLAFPLIRAGSGPGVLAALFDWLARDRQGAALLECRRISGDGGFYHLLLEYVNARGRGLLVSDAHPRALLRKGAPLADGLGGERRKKLRRAEERLAEAGPVTYACLPDDGDVEAWLADFVRLEASGWKLRAGTALACCETDRQFFLEVARAAFKRRRLMMLALNAGGKPIAQLCNFLAGDGSFAFKVAFDEAHARYSPGALLELENLRQVEARPGLRWMDSCTEAGDSLVKHLWADRRVIQTVLVETGRAPGSFVLAMLPLWRWLRRRLGAVFAWFRPAAPAETR